MGYKCRDALEWLLGAVVADCVWAYRADEDGPPCIGDLGVEDPPCNEDLGDGALRAVFDDGGTREGEAMGGFAVTAAQDVAADFGDRAAAGWTATGGDAAGVFRGDFPAAWSATTKRFSK